MAGQRVLANDGYGFVWGEIMFVVIEDKQVESGDETIRRVAGDQVHLSVFQGASQETQIHDPGIAGEMQAVVGGKSLVAVGALHEFVAESGAPFWRVRRGLRDGFQAQKASIFTSNFDGEGVVEAEWRANHQGETLCIFRLDFVVNLLSPAVRAFFQDCSQGCAGVFGIDINAPSEYGLLADIGASEIEAGFDGKMGFGFNLLGDDFSEDELLGEVFGADDNAIFARRAASDE